MGELAADATRVVHIQRECLHCFPVRGMHCLKSADVEHAYAKKWANANMREDDSGKPKSPAYSAVAGVAPWRFSNEAAPSASKAGSSSGSSSSDEQALQPSLYRERVRSGNNINCQVRLQS